MNNKNTSIEIDTDGKGNLMYQGNGVVDIHFSRQSTLRVS